MGCTDLLHITLGSVLGLAFTLFYIMILSRNPELLYYNDMLSSKVACSVPSKQKFKWQVRTTKINKNKKISMTKKYQKQAFQKIGYHLPIYKSQQI
jgi:hypothetical protein